MSEKQLVIKIRKALKEQYPKDVYYKIHGGLSQERGMPDILGCHDGRFVGMEVKTPERFAKEGPTEYQKHQLARIKKAGGISGVVTSIHEALQLIANN